MGIIWTIVIGFIAGVIAKFIMPGSNEPSGFILTTILGSWERSLRAFSAKRLDGMRLVKVRGSSARSSVPLSSWLSGGPSPSGACRGHRAPCSVMNLSKDRKPGCQI